MFSCIHGRNTAPRRENARLISTLISKSRSADALAAGDRAEIGMKDWSNAPWVDPSLGWKPRPVSELPERALIDFATKCNLRCPMCTVWGSGDDEAIDAVKGIMDVEGARRVLDEMMAAKPLIQPSMYGEPL